MLRKYRTDRNLHFSKRILMITTNGGNEILELTNSILKTHVALGSADNNGDDEPLSSHSYSPRLWCFSFKPEDFRVRTSQMGCRGSAGRISYEFINIGFVGYSSSCAHMWLVRGKWSWDG